MPENDAGGARTIFTDTGIRRALMRIAHEILERNEDPTNLYLVAIPNGGVPLARQLAASEFDTLVSLAAARATPKRPACCPSRLRASVEASLPALPVRSSRASSLEVLPPEVVFRRDSWSLRRRTCPG